MANQELSWRPLARAAAITLALSIWSVGCSGGGSGAPVQADGPSEPPPVGGVAEETEAPEQAGEPSEPPPADGVTEDLGGEVTYEAVFLRNQPTADDAGDVLVIAVSPDGTEREAGRLIGRAAVDPDSGQFVAPQGAVSPGGLLAILRTRDGFGFVGARRVYEFYTEIIELPGWPRWVGDSRFGFSDSEPRLLAAWGPDDQVALLVDDYLGRELRVVQVPASGSLNQLLLGRDYGHDYRLAERDSFMEAYRPVLTSDRPVWASDGSGLILRSWPYDERLGVLLLDSDVRDGVPGAVVDGIGGRPIRADAATLDILSDFGPHVVRILYPDGREDTLGTLPEIGQGSLRHSDLAWTADGAGAWLITEEPEDGSRVIRLGRFDPPTLETLSLEFEAAAEPEPSDGIPAATFAGLAPDDSLIVLTIAGRELATLVEPESGTTFDMDGTFAGWLIKD